jgi:flagellar transcriptional activator FlhD
MNTSQLHQEIRNTNLSFMQLCQQMIRQDKAQAVTALGVSEEMADLVAGLSPAHLLKLSATSMFLCSFRFDDNVLLNMLGGYTREVRTEENAQKAELVAA